MAFIAIERSVTAGPNGSGYMERGDRKVNQACVKPLRGPVEGRKRRVLTGAQKAALVPANLSRNVTFRARFENGPPGYVRIGNSDLG